ncbi:hypothetical protein E4T44_03891 [Aureobasidium sp. EXF-8845]|nr:hypothetical protein E4T44_03891 [Aureobasidium sp. EXF-8845]KAI4849933.1 hypothetical protein E4T45_05719 [Aureobasidium sp. EXF-8846]
MFSIQSICATILFTFAVYTNGSQPSPRELEPRDGGAWTNAYCMPSQPQNLSPATIATCPSWSPITCTAIGEASYCCVPSTYCMRASDNSIGCCPWGQTCTSTPAAAAGAGGEQWQSQPQQSTWQQPQPTTQVSTIYVTQTHPTTVVYAAGGQQATTVYPGLIGQGQGQEGQYCSTLYAHGNNLPTTEAGTCGTILIANTGVKKRATEKWILAWVTLVAMAVS